MDQNRPRPRRLRRRYERLESLGLFAAMERGRSSELPLDDPGRLKDFLGRVEGGLGEALSSPTTLHGWRVENLFEELTAALGEIDLLKTEDAGDVIYRGEKPKIPDFRVVPVEGQSFLVEVKNFNQPRTNPWKDYSMSNGELAGLRIYRDLAAPGWPIKLAVYWTRWNKWTLVDEERLALEGNRRVLPMMDALKANEMGLLGDVMLGTRFPLVLRLEAQRSALRELRGGQAIFTVGGVELACAGKILRGVTERHLALLFMLWGEWEEEVEAETTAGQLDAINFTFAPPDYENPELQRQGFSMVVFLSSMYSAIFNSRTLQEGEVTGLTGPLETPDLGMLVPENYASDELPLWRFHLQPSKEPAQISNRDL